MREWLYESAAKSIVSFMSDCCMGCIKAKHDRQNGRIFLMVTC